MDEGFCRGIRLSSYQGPNIGSMSVMFTKSTDSILGSLRQGQFVAFCDVFIQAMAHDKVYDAYLVARASSLRASGLRQSQAWNLWGSGLNVNVLRAVRLQVRGVSAKVLSLRPRCLQTSTSMCHLCS